MYDLVIKNARVLDGSGKDEFIADIVISEDKIVEVGKVEQPETRATIDASGFLVMPGFIDIHSHSDESYFVNPLGESKLRQGITTEVIGNCGYSSFPLSEEVRHRYQDTLREWGVRIEWTTPEEYLERLEKTKPAINIVPLVGHGTLRANVIGYEDRLPSEDELKKMKDLLREALSSGCWGLSTGLIYPPGCFAQTDELIELARVLKEYGGFYTSHIRSEGDDLLSAVEEAITIGQSADVPVEISHLKAAGRRNWGKAAQAIEMIVNARENKGVDVGFDRYPYTASATDLGSLLPHWAHEGGRKKTIDYIRDPETSDRIIDEMRRNLEGKDGWGSILLSYAGCPEYEQFEGLSIKEIASIKRITPEVLVFHLLLRSRFTATICSFTMNGKETEQILTHPLCVVCTDASARALTGPLSKGKPHPRAFGSFPKFFRNYVKEKRLLRLGEAVAKTTSVPAQRIGLKQRGLIKSGYFADLLVIDWEQFTDTASYENPKNFAQGIMAIIVNGKVVFLDGKYTDERPGRLLLRS